MKKYVKVGLITAGIAAGVGVVGYLAYRGWKSISKSLEDCVFDDDLCCGCDVDGHNSLDCDDACKCECLAGAAEK